MIPQIRLSRIALLGNCQATALYRIFRLIAPSIEVRRILFNELEAKFPTREDVFAAFEEYDVIFAPPFGPGLHPGVDGMLLQKRFGKRFRFYPIVEFNAFHPDCVYIWDHRRREWSPSPVGDYHSAIVFLGYQLGFSVDQTLKLFNREIFEALGYFQFWKISENVLLQQCRSVDFPIEASYRSWLRRGAFMHSVNHPKLFVLADIARTMLKHFSVPIACDNVEDYLPDEALFDAMWPVYPEIGESMGVQGAYIFKCGSRSDEGTPFMTLHSMVERSYALYKGERQGSLECRRIDDWMKSAELMKFIRQHANP